MNENQKSESKDSSTNEENDQMINEIKTKEKSLIILMFMLFAFLLVVIFLGLWYILKQIEQASSSLSQEFNWKLSQLNAKLSQTSSQVNWLASKSDSTESRQKTVEEDPRKQQILIDQSLQSRKIQQDSSQLRENTLQTFCYVYNACVDTPQKKVEFRERYQAIHTIGVKNTQKRLQDSNIEPIFITASNGSYYAVEIEENGRIRYAVVPKFDLTFQEANYGAGAMGLVFDCPNYNPQLRYRRVKVVKPAIFEPDSAKQYWMLKEKGKLDLGQGEQI